MYTSSSNIIYNFLCTLGQFGVLMERWSLTYPTTRIALVVVASLLSVVMA